MEEHIINLQQEIQHIQNVMRILEKRDNINSLSSDEKIVLINLVACGKNIIYDLNEKLRNINPFIEEFIPFPERFSGDIILQTYEVLTQGSKINSLFSQKNNSDRIHQDIETLVKNIIEIEANTEFSSEVVNCFSNILEKQFNRQHLDEVLKKLNDGIFTITIVF